MQKVIYLSFAQGNAIDGELLSKNVSAVMIRAGQGIWEDPLFRYNYQLCLDHKIPFGIWWFNQPDMVASLQVTAFMKLWKTLPVKPKVIAYDVEEIDYYDDNNKPQKLFPPSRKFSHDNVLEWCKSIKTLTNTKVGIYTRKLYFEQWTYETPEWYQFWMWIAAWYIYTGEVQPLLPYNWPEYKIHQYEGGGPGTPGVDPSHTCKEYFNGSYEECMKFFEFPVSIEGGITMAEIEVKTTPQIQRAKILHWKPNQKLATSISKLNADAIILTIGGMERIVNNQPVIYAEDTFKARYNLVRQSGFPVIARFNLHAGYWTIKQYGKDAVLRETAQGIFDEKQKEESVRKNQVIPKILQNLCDDFTMDKLFARQLKWYDVKLLDILNIEEKGFNGSEIGDVWHRASWDHLTLGLRWLMFRGYIPEMKIVMLTTADWLDKLPQDGEFKNMMSFSKDWLYLHIGQWTQFSTATFADPAELWKTRPAEDFVWRKISTQSKWYPPDGYSNRILMHLYAELQNLEGLPGSEAELNLYWDTKEKLYELLGFNPTQTPPVETTPPETPPVVTNPDILARLIALENWAKSFPKF